MPRPPLDFRDIGLADIPRLLPELLAQRRPVKAITMAQARLSNGQQLYAVNDLFVRLKTHSSPRYETGLQDWAP